MHNTMVWKGVVEGFYGKPWTRAQRADMFGFMQQVGMNAYMYAPKDDPYHRERWRVHYPTAKFDELASLAKSAREHNISFVFAISPGLSLRYSDKREIESFMAKARAVYDVGVKDFAILYDDIPMKLTDEADQRAFASLGTAQAAFASSVFARLRALNGSARLIVCPTHYNGDPNVDYIRDLASNLDTSIDIMWTGPWVCSRSISAEHAKLVAEAFGRPATLWDNYPVNDALMHSELHIGPYTGRDPELCETVRGIFVNPMEHAEASKIGIGAAARFMNTAHEEGGYDPKESWRWAAKQVVGEKAIDSLWIFADACARSPLYDGEPPELGASCRDAKEKLSWGQLTVTRGVLASYSLKMKSSVEMLRTVSNPRFLNEIKPWLDEFADWAELGQHAAELVDSVITFLAGSWDYSRMRKRSLRALPVLKARARLRRALEATCGHTTTVCGNSLLIVALEIMKKLR